MVECTINGIPVKFPFEPYELQKNYMSKVIECLTNETHGVLESPTGTGKTLSLLCSSLAWLEVKKAQVQAQWQANAFNMKEEENQMSDLLSELNNIGGKSRTPLMGLPQIIYSSRTHSQLTQAMQELKRSNYNYMKASVLGSREQMCIHPEVMKEENGAMKINMCRVKVQTRSCHFYNRVEKQKENPAIMEQKVVDIEDLVKLGDTHKFCPYFMSKEMKQRADIIFMPYNYLLDPRARKALGVELSNNIIILDEAHNVEKICEDSASLQVKSTDIALCIDEVTEVMKAISDDRNDFDFKDSPPDFTPEELCTLKQMFLDFEKAVDGVEIKNPQEGSTFPGNYIFEILASSGIRDENNGAVIGLIEKIATFLATVNSGPFQRKGHGLQLFEDMLRIAFASTKADFKEKIQKCYKVHVIDEKPLNKQASNWLTKATTKSGCRVLSYWCFSPGFGMNMLMDQGVKCVILTSGTLAPLKPLITELELKVTVQLENPHIVTAEQVCVKILGKGPDGNVLNCSYRNRDNIDYIKSLGMTISNLSRIIPSGLLIFFPSYPIMKKCRDAWEECGLWRSISQTKNIFMEPKQKAAFQEEMTNYYKTVHDPNQSGAIFMGVCRGKVSEGLDFADANGRAVIIIGLPYPPLKDPRIVLKKRYLDVCRSSNKEYISGDDWYNLEATKAVNQAIGRVIRHRNDYGAILLLDSRFNNPRIINHMSLWLRSRIQNVNSFGAIVRDLRGFFREAAIKFPVATLRPLRDNTTQPVPASFDTTASYKKETMFSFNQNSSSSSSNSSGLVNIHKRGGEVSQSIPKRKKITLIPNKPVTTETNSHSEIREYLAMVKKSLNPDEYTSFMGTIRTYRDQNDLDELLRELDRFFLPKPNLRYIILGLQTYIKAEHEAAFGAYLDKIR